jgi:YD repeat-containing protein
MPRAASCKPSPTAPATPRAWLTATALQVANGGYILDATGNATTAILPAGLLIRVVDAAGRALNFSYDANSRIVRMTDPAGGVYLYAYDEASSVVLGTNPKSNNLTSVTYPDGHKRIYWYNEQANTTNTNLPNALTGISDENGVRYASYRYDAQGRAYDEDHGTGQVGGAVDHYNLVYNIGTSGNPVSTVVTDPLGTARTYNFTTVLGVVKSTGVNQPGGSGCAAAGSNLTYDANGNVASRTDFNGVVTTYAYDLTRNLETRRTEASGTPQARTITTVWHPSFRLPTQISEPGRVTTYSYDPSYGNRLSQTVTDTATGSARTTAYTYTSAADGTLPNLLKSTDGPRPDVSDVTTYGYYPNGDLQRVANALGQITTLNSYDANGKPLSLTDPNGLTTSLSYTARGWLASQSVGSQTTAYTYDGVGQLTQISLPGGQYITYTFDAAHRLTDIRDGLSNRIHYTLDGMGNRTQTDTYDGSGALVSTHRQRFDALNRLYQDIGALNQTTTYAYDANGNLKSTTDPLNHSTSYQYDALNRLTQTTDASLGKTTYSYNPLDQLTQIADPKALATAYAINAFGEHLSERSPDTGTTSYTYDAAGNLGSKTDAKQQTTASTTP